VTIVEARTSPDAIHNIRAERPLRLAIVVSHPIQYYVPVYRVLAARDDVELRVFYTWHGSDEGQWDVGFKQPIAWDVPLTEGYDFEVVPNVSARPSTDHFFGLRNPGLVRRVLAWKPDVVHLTGYAYASHLRLLRRLPRYGIPALFRGDSHLLLPRPQWKRWLRLMALRRIFRSPAGFLYVGQHNRDYFRASRVPENKLFYCPHSIEFERFAGSDKALEAEARQWRRSLGIGDDQIVLLFAGKFQSIKQPLELMRAVALADDPRLVLVMVGDGPEAAGVAQLAATAPTCFRVLPFQNQSRMPLIYRLGDVFVLPSISETWGLAVNEAMACRRPVLVSDAVGCAPDLVRPSVTGDVFRSGDWDDFLCKMRSLADQGMDSLRSLGQAGQELSSHYTPKTTAESVIFAARSILMSRMNVQHHQAIAGEHWSAP
jgi:glycosyltransferase involved in cell wall biosynthesis